MARKGLFWTPPGPRAEDVFTDREQSREVLRSFFRELLARPFTPDERFTPIKAFHGVGGAGKTALRNKAVDDFRRETSDQGGYPLAFAEVDLDSDIVTPEYPIFELFFRHLRTALKKVEVPLPLFDVYCLAWKARLAESGDFGREQIEELLGKHEQTAGFVGTLWEQAKDYATTVKGARLLLHTAIAFRDRRRRQRYDERFPALELAELTNADFEQYAPLILAEDLIDFLTTQGERNSHPYALCLLIDGFERIRRR
ncbi:MAG: hypothetical protein V5B39_07165 [Accumulibacter sp.]|jgi:hypothetical protein|uniref:hypothetical protein n=1 Tax=Accumulibacter sp. TaxID=2053492 RepID=UPI002FC2EEC8